MALVSSVGALTPTSGRRCDEFGNFIPEDSPKPTDPRGANNWFPYTSRIQFELSDFLYRRNQMSRGDINDLMEIWAASLIQATGDTDTPPPFLDAKALYETIDAIEVGDAPWASITVSYTGPLPDHPPSWMLDKHQVYYRDPKTVVENMLRNPDFNGEFDYSPYVEYGLDGKRRWSDFFSGDWVWNQSVCIFLSFSGSQLRAYGGLCTRTL